MSIYRRLITERHDPLEPILLEMEGMRLLRSKGLKLDLLHSGAGSNLNYECEVTLPSGEIVYCEMKCKLETTEFLVKTLHNSLETARKQLPKDKCGVILLKLPQSWPLTNAALSIIAAGIERFLANSGRVSEIIIYWFQLADVQGLVPEGKKGGLILTKEFLNQRSPHVGILGKGILKEGPFVPYKWTFFTEGVEFLGGHPLSIAY